MNLWRLSVDFHMWYVWRFLCVVCHVSFHYPPYETVCCCYQTVFSYLSLMLCLWWLISSPHLPFIVLLSCPTFPLPSPSFLSLHLLSLCPSSCLPPLSHFHLCFLPALSGISLWRWIWSRCANTAMSASLMTWNVGWPSENVTQKRRRRNWYPCVCDPSLSALSLLQLIFPLVSFCLPCYLFQFFPTFHATFNP